MNVKLGTVSAVKQGAGQQIRRRPGRFINLGRDAGNIIACAPANIACAEINTGRSVFTRRINMLQRADEQIGITIAGDIADSYGHCGIAVGAMQLETVGAV